MNWYEHFNPVAFELFGLKVHWYGITYIIALISALFFSLLFIREKRFHNITRKSFEDFFIVAEIGILLGARLGYVLIYSPERWEYFTHPWLIFSPFDSMGNFVGISGMSYHGGVVGFLVASIVYTYYKNLPLLRYLDLMALGVPLAYIFGRIGNFLNHELYGRIIPDSDTFWKPYGILIDGALRYPSQLIEAFLEGFVVFWIVFFARKRFLFDGALISIYAMSYACMRFIAEFYREADVQMGYYGFLTMGQILSLAMLICALALFFYAKHLQTSQKGKQ
ncbi:prolipoprotein diacylglyceryl transferase [Helicobacter enhydrae]|uniref:Phosphatidylglycerol--prolipoprotein diacylglyceryl transferase n=1 Tax=Helicobacter enhydrae TaxID=222136 RepID=A0A1B1U6T0_9HELI|nr:prolipoprotein diacylglyceryl transferase [Helicobacter enhydrae]ANV98402.1 prolipoprotein diacylglyceryl transferase [Helicobacter enhydrae]